jgi:hypothetical protein
VPLQTNPVRQPDAAGHPEQDAEENVDQQILASTRFQKYRQRRQQYGNDDKKKLVHTKILPKTDSTVIPIPW